MKSIRMMVPVFGLMVALAGCSGGAGATSGSDSTSATQAESDVVTTTTTDGGAGARRDAHGPRHGGPESLVFAALHENISLSAAQRSTIEGLANAAQHGPTGHPAPDPARIAALAAAIRAGNVDNLAPPNDANEQAEHQAHQAAAANAIGTLHNTLSKDQRTALVDAILAKMANGPHGDHDHGDPDGKGPGHGPGPDADAHGGPHGPMGGLLQGLNLTAQQQATIKAKFDALRPSDADRDARKAQFEARKADREAKLKTFEDDSFDASAFVAPPADAKGGPGFGGPGHGPNELAIIVPVLDATQREALAKKIEAGPPAHGPGQGSDPRPPQD